MENGDPAARLWEADNLVALLGKLDPDSLPSHEGEAVAKCQADAVEDWLSAFIALRDRAKAEPVG